MKSRVRHYRGNEASVTFDTHRCIHAEVSGGSRRFAHCRYCVRGYDVRPGAASGIRCLAPPLDPAGRGRSETARKSRAGLSHRGAPHGGGHRRTSSAGRRSGRDHPSRNAAKQELALRRAGWAALRARQQLPSSKKYAVFFDYDGSLEIEETPGAEILPDTRVGFCRCGASENKPLCDQSHARVGFRCGAEVSPRAGATPPVGDEMAPVRFTPQPNGPLLFRGPLTIAGRGGVRVTLDRGALCRCG